MGMTLDQALEKMYERMPTAELRFFAIVLNIQQKTGGNLAEALGNLSAVLRAAQADAREDQGPVVRRRRPRRSSSAACRRAWSLLISDHHAVLHGADVHRSARPADAGRRRVWMAMGIFVMRRMINFKF